jgi:hypothetical protein
MHKPPIVPRDLQKSFTKLMDLIPAPFRYEQQVQKDILLFLKLEGEEFVRNKIEQSKEAFSGRTEGDVVEDKNGE